MSEPDEFLPGGAQGPPLLHHVADAKLAPFAIENREAKEALRPILATNRLSRFRLLDVACGGPRSHRLVQVIRTAQGLVLVGVGPDDHLKIYEHGGTEYDTNDPDGPYGISAYDWKVEMQYTTRSSRMAHFCEFLEELAEDGRSVVAQCRCQTAEIPAVVLVAHINAGSRRIRHYGREGTPNVVALRSAATAC